MANSPQTQAYLQALGEALVPVAEKLKAGYSASASQYLPSSDIMELVSRHLQRLADDTEQLQDEINGLGASIRQNADLASLDWRVGRLESRIENLVEARAEVSSWDGDTEDSDGRFLLLVIYNRLYRELGSWLEEVIEVCTDLEGSLKRRGLATTGTVSLTLILRLTTPPEVQELAEWCRRRQMEKRRQASAPARRPEPGTAWNTPLTELEKGALALVGAVVLAVLFLTLEAAFPNFFAFLNGLFLFGVVVFGASCLTVKTLAVIGEILRGGR